MKKINLQEIFFEKSNQDTQENIDQSKHGVKFNKIEFFIIVIVSILALCIRFLGIEHISRDMEMCLLQWVDKIVEYGRLESFKHIIGDYYVSYMYILTFISLLPFQYMYSIKFVSIIFDFIMAFFVAKLTYNVTKNKTKSIVAYCIVLFLPTVVYNSSSWGQCDSIYTTFIMISLCLLIEKKYSKSIIFLGIAFAFKLQTVFILPLYILYWISGNKRPFKLRKFLYFFVPYIIMGIPAILMGRGIIDTYGTYFKQAGEFSNTLTNVNFNFYTLIVPKKNATKTGDNTLIFNNPLLDNIGIIILLLFFIILFIKEFKLKKEMKNEQIISIGLWVVLIANFFLPHMHDRYMYVADILAVSYSLIYLDRFFEFTIMQIISLNTYWYFYKYLSVSRYFWSILTFLNIIYIGYYIINERIAKEKENSEKNNVNNKTNFKFNKTNINISRKTL